MRAVPLLLVLALAGCATTPSAPDPTQTPALAPLTLTAYQGAWSDPAAITANAQHISVVAVDGLNLTSAADVEQPGADAVAQLTAAHDAGLPAEIMLGNYNADIEDFDEERAWQTLGDEKAIQRVVDSMRTAVTEQGWDGVSVDLESLTARDAEGLSLLLASLRQALGPEKSISIALMLAETPDGYAELGYNLPAIAAVVDRVILMAYDEHGPWEQTAGPVGSLAWQTTGVQALLSTVPPEQVELGVARYGYSWGPDESTSITIAEARTLAGDAASFDSEIGEWTATLDDGTVLWWSDADSYELRVVLAQQFALHGLAIWELGASDPLR